ncbi:StAR-related lipid transfer (START) domain containing 10 [Columba livia]|uniref:START domain-containing protein 10 n=1 Tax=Columba livia TaxID=8932 RepID=A0A2I0LIL4_COLLI|nr:StAR-related lipid transfer (START) domain containing 10 [Columba livia]
MECKDVPAATLYDVLHDIEYRKKWDSNVIETFDIGRLTVNSDVGYYAWRCPKPLKNRDVITLRSWLPMGTDYIIMNYSVKHPKYPPRKDMVRAVSIQTGYLIEGTGANSCTITYLAQVSPGSLPKWVVNKSSPPLPLAVLSLQHADSLENIDESALAEGKDERGDASDEDSVN